MQEFHEDQLREVLEEYLSGLTSEEDRDAFTIKEACVATGLSSYAMRTRLKRLIRSGDLLPSWCRKCNDWGVVQLVKGYRFKNGETDRSEVE